MFPKVPIRKQRQQIKPFKKYPVSVDVDELIRKLLFSQAQ